MSDEPGIETTLQRRVLQSALRNGSRSTALLVIVAAIIATLGWQKGQALAAVICAALGAAGAFWRWGLNHHYGDTESLSDAQVRSVFLQLEANTAVVGLM